MTKYKFLCKKIINGKKRNIYISDKTKKEYLKYKNKFMQVSKYKKLKNTTRTKTTKTTKTTKKPKIKGGYQSDTQVAGSVCRNLDPDFNAEFVNQIQTKAAQLQLQNCGDQAVGDGDCAAANSLLSTLKVGGKKKKK
jgi:hypothetical protein